MTTEGQPGEGTAGEHPAAHRALPARRMRWVAVVALMLLSPFCAEYLIGYQGVITDPSGMLVAVLMVLPIYGAPAVLIREFVRRTGRGWPSMLLLAAAAGLIQAGLIDQSLFNHRDFGGAPRLPIPGLDVDAGEVLTYIGGHIVWSFGAPIAVIESCLPNARSGTRPAPAEKVESRPIHQPWLGIPGLIVVTVIYLAGAVFYYNELVRKVGFVIGPGQLIAVLLAVGLAVALAIGWPHRRRRDGAVRSPALTVVVMSLLAVTFVLFDEVLGWVGLGLRLLVVIIAAGLLTACSRRTGWTSGHTLAAAAAPLLVYAGLAFAVNPESEPTVTLYTARGIVAAGMVALLGFATWRRARVAAAGSRRTGTGDGDGG